MHQALCQFAIFSEPRIISGGRYLHLTGEKIGSQRSNQSNVTGPESDRIGIKICQLKCYLLRRPNPTTLIKLTTLSKPVYFLDSYYPICLFTCPLLASLQNVQFMKARFFLSHLFLCLQRLELAYNTTDTRKCLLND